MESKHNSELDEKRMAARVALSKAPSTDKPPTQKPRVEAKHSSQPKGLSADELYEKRMAARRALGDTKPPSARPLSNDDQINKLAQEAVSRGHEMAQMSLQNKVPKESPKIKQKKEGGVHDLGVPLELKDPLAKIQEETPPPPLTETKKAPPQKQELAKKHKHESLAEIALHEQERRRTIEQQRYVSKQTGWRAIVFIVAIVLLLGAGGFALYSVFQEDEPATVTPPVIERTYLIPPDVEEVIDIAQEEPTRAVRALLVSPDISSGSVLGIRFIDSERDISPTDGEEDLSYDETLSALSLAMPRSIARAITDNFMVGVYGDDTNTAFLAFTVSTFETLAGFLSWEKQDLYTLYGVLHGGALDPLGRNATWKDSSIKNVDARVLMDETGDIYLIYSFINKETVIITPSKDAFIELLDRYRVPEKVLR